MITGDVPLNSYKVKLELFPVTQNVFRVVRGTEFTVEFEEESKNMSDFRE